MGRNALGTRFPDWVRFWYPVLVHTWFHKLGGNRFHDFSISGSSFWANAVPAFSKSRYPLFCYFWFHVFAISGHQPRYFLVPKIGTVGFFNGISKEFAPWPRLLVPNWASERTSNPIGMGTTFGSKTGTTFGKKWVPLLGEKWVPLLGKKWVPVLAPNRVPLLGKKWEPKSTNPRQTGPGSRMGPPPRPGAGTRSRKENGIRCRPEAGTEPAA